MMEFALNRWMHTGWWLQSFLRFAWFLVLLVFAYACACQHTSLAEAQNVPLVPPTQPIQPDQPSPLDDDDPGPDAPVISSIIIEGNQRIDPETVLSYMATETGDRYSEVRLNQAIKDLFATGLFADVAISFDGGEMLVKVTENPVINRIAFEGNDVISDELLESELTLLRPRRVFTRAEIQSAVRRLLDLYRRQGRYAAKVEPKIIRQEQNRIDVVFEINEGPVTTIQNIYFVGNRFFSDSALKGIVRSKEDRWYRFLVDTDRYDPDRISFDRELLRRHYLKNGFIDFRISSAVAELMEDLSGFNITFTIEEGERFKFGDISLQSDIPNVDTDALNEDVLVEEGEWYNIDLIDDSSVALTRSMGNLGYAFVNIEPNIGRDDVAKTIDIQFLIREGRRAYIERIDI
ncbi:MAG: outer membrane protein assembly factor BamA, partial [Pseudomonadota bacterium]